MTTKTKLFTSAMAGAPVLSGSAGALIALLDAILVNGFASGSVTSIVVLDDIATVTYPSGHPFSVDSVALYAGATPAGLNGEKRILSTTSSTVTFATSGISNQTASGTITSKVAPAGWAKAFTGTNLAAYKANAAEATGCLLRVDDTGTTNARVRGFEAMSDVSTGTGLFPSAVQFASGLWWAKSNAASAAARPWRVFADDRGFYLFVKNQDTAAESIGYYFGDILSLKSNDPYACALRANAVDRSATGAGSFGDDFVYADLSNSQDGLYLARGANTLGGSVVHYMAPVLNLPRISNYIAGSVGLTYPSPTDNGLMLSPCMIYTTSAYRGYFPGLNYTPQAAASSFATGDIVAGSGAMTGKKVSAVRMGANTGNAGVVFMDHTSDWRA